MQAWTICSNTKEATDTWPQFQHTSIYLHCSTKGKKREGKTKRLEKNCCKNFRIIFCRFILQKQGNFNGSFIFLHLIKKWGQLTFGDCSSVQSQRTNNIVESVCGGKLWVGLFFLFNILIKVIDNLLIFQWLY